MSGTLFLALCLAVTAANAAGTKRLHPLPANAVILAFGDSLTFGTGAAPGKSYPAVLEKLVSRKVINAGIPGETTTWGLARLPALLAEHRPSLLILCHGANDLIQGLGERQAADNIREMIRLARKHGAQVLLIGVPYPGRFTSQPPFYAMIADEFNIQFARDALAGVLVNPSLKSDFIHPKARGYRKMAEAIAAVLRENGAF
jgi:lysophospholipase L1-like esterase